ncbi:hypothetical protein [Amycolatopsis tolypomycina]
MKDDKRAQPTTEAELGEPGPAGPEPFGPGEDPETLEPTIVLGRE